MTATSASSPRRGELRHLPTLLVVVLDSTTGLVVEPESRRGEEISLEESPGTAIDTLGPQIFAPTARWSEDLGAWSSSLASDAYTAGEATRYLSMRPRADDRVLDLGAHIGLASLALLRAGVQYIVAVEPEPHNLEVLRLNLDPWNAVEGYRVEVVDAAVSKEAGQATLWSSLGACTTLHSLSPAKHRVPVVVRTVTLDDLLQAHRPTLLKVDIEGEELELVEELSDLPAEVRAVAMEIHIGRGPKKRLAQAQKLDEVMRRQGFTTSNPINWESKRGTRTPTYRRTAK